MVARSRGFGAALGLGLDRALGMRAVVEQIHVEIAVRVVVEEHGLGRIAGVLETVLPGAIGEGAVAVVDVEHVAPVHREVFDARHVDVDAPIAVDVRHRDAGLPAIRVGDARLVGDILELIVPLVPIELVGTKVRGEIKILESIAIDITNSDAAAVVVVEIVDDVEVRRLRQLIDELYAGGLRRQQLKQRLRRTRSGFLFSVARTQHEHAGDSETIQSGSRKKP